MAVPLPGPDAPADLHDYNGSRPAMAGPNDQSYSLGSARTVYVLQIYDNDESLFQLGTREPINHDPAPPEVPYAVLKITVEGLRAWITDYVGDPTSIDDVSIQDLGGIAGGPEKFTGRQPRWHRTDLRRSRITLFFS